MRLCRLSKEPGELPGRQMVILCRECAAVGILHTLHHSWQRPLLLPARVARRQPSPHVKFPAGKASKWSHT
jgi:hypothetical protein